jgi:hypothetical protein
MPRAWARLAGVRPLMAPALMPRAVMSQVLAAAAMLWAMTATPLAFAQANPANSPAVELARFDLAKTDDALQLSFLARYELPKPVEEALQRGTSLYFVAQADVLRSRWYWRDERVAQVRRTWRLTFQPLTQTYRVSFGGLNQSFDRLDQALAAVRGITEWRLADAKEVDDGKVYVEFSYALDTALLPRPLQIGVLGQSDWLIKVERSQRLP